MSNPLPRLLIVEDDPTIAGNLFAFFETRGSPSMPPMTGAPRCSAWPVQASKR
jgi:hypothetical protein